MIVRGEAVCLGPDIDTDIIIAGRYLRTKDRSVWAEHCMEDLDPDLAARLKGKIIVADKNFGCGSSREQAVIALKEAGVVAVIAKSIARIFFRNAVNRGLPVIECDLECIDGEVVSFNLDEGWITTESGRYEFKPPSERMIGIIREGGLVNYLRKNAEDNSGAR